VEGVTKLGEFLRQEWRLQKQQREIDALRAQVAKLEAQNARTQQAMRRCITCDYRLEAIAGRDEAKHTQSEIT
jgi:Tfp pilus assembly protein PilN